MSKAFIVAHKEETDSVDSIFGIPVFYSGVGKVNAAMKAMELVGTKLYREIINIGSCGSRKHDIGTILQIGSAIQDIDASPLCEYGTTPFEQDSDIVPISDHAAMCFTTDCFYDETKAGLSLEYKQRVSISDAIDMECYAIAKVCRNNWVKFKCFKWVSDTGDGSDWKKNKNIGYNAFASSFKNFV